MLLKKIIVQHVKNFLEPREQKLRRKLIVAGPVILHDNARPHIADVATKKLGWEMLPHAPYRPDMSPPDFNLFPKLKSMHGRRFSSLEKLSTNGTKAIQHMNKSGVLDGIIMLPKRCHLVIEKQGECIEG